MVMREVLYVLGISKSTLYKYLKSGKIQAQKGENGCYDYHSESVFRLKKEKEQKKVGSQDIVHILNISISTLYKYIKEGKIQAKKLPDGSYEYDMESVHRLKNTKMMTTKEILSFLDISDSTLYQYIKKGKIQVKRLPSGKYLYDMESVSRLKEEMNGIKKNFMTTKEVLAFLNISRSTLYQYIKDGKIQAKKRPDGTYIYDQEYIHHVKQEKAMSTKDVLSLLKISNQTLYRYIRKGIIQAEKLPNGKYQYNQESVYSLSALRILGNLIK